MNLTQTILTMAFVFLVLLAVATAQSVLTFLLIRENKRLTNGKATHDRIEEVARSVVTLAASVRATDRDVTGIAELVSTFSNRNAVRGKRKRKEEAEPDEEIPEESRHLFGLGG